MATTTINSVPAKIIELIASPVENILQIATPNQHPTQEREYTIEVIVGTYTFSAGNAISAENQTFTVGGKFIITLSELHQLRYKATAQSDRFDIIQ